MAERKRNEGMFGNMMRKLGFWVHKSGDRRYPDCPTCHRQVTVCPHCHGSMLFQKAESYPDFLIAERIVYAEAKGAGDSFSWGDMITPKQRVMMVDGTEAWMFLEIGLGRLPLGKEAYFIPWERWLVVEKDLEQEGFKSILWRKTARSKNPTAKEKLYPWKLEWKPKEGIVEGHWTIPKGHIWWHYHSWEHANIHTD